MSSTENMLSSKISESYQSYLADTLIPSTSSNVHDAQRKLLVLDLNGTLLYRTRLNSSVKNAHRHVYPRPYIPSFREYLFHPSTKEWLDTIVLSSAQPRNVDDMVDHCFGQFRENLKAVRARDTLGLEVGQYNRKVQTVKDLAKLWKEFPPHSVKTTILLDDSPKKAQLQPWNHIVVSDYTSDLRKHDLDVLTSDLHSESQKKPKKKKKSTTVTVNVAPDVEPSIVKKTYDDTLLSIIGILDVLKSQSNIAFWLRKGGIPNLGSLLSTDTSLTKMWFSNPETTKYWSEQGRKVLADLGIKIEHGVRQSCEH